MPHTATAIARPMDTPTPTSTAPLTTAPCCTEAASACCAAAGDITAPILADLESAAGRLGRLQRDLGRLIQERRQLRSTNAILTSANESLLQRQTEDAALIANLRHTVATLRDSGVDRDEHLVDAEMAALRARADEAQQQYCAAAREAADLRRQVEVLLREAQQGEARQREVKFSGE